MLCSSGKRWLSNIPQLLAGFAHQATVVVTTTKQSPPSPMLLSSTLEGKVHSLSCQDVSTKLLLGHWHYPLTIHLPFQNAISSSFLGQRYGLSIQPVTFYHLIFLFLQSVVAPMLELQYNYHGILDHHEAANVMGCAQRLGKVLAFLKNLEAGNSWTASITHCFSFILAAQKCEKWRFVFLTLPSLLLPLSTKQEVWVMLGVHGSWRMEWGNGAGMWTRGYHPWQAGGGCRLRVKDTQVCRPLPNNSLLSMNQRVQVMDGLPHKQPHLYMHLTQWFSLAQGSTFKNDSLLGPT